MLSKTRIKKARFRSETKNGILMQLKSAFSIQVFSNMISNWTRQSEKLRFSIQLASRVHASEMLESPAVYSYEYHTPTQQHDIPRNPTPHHRRRMAWLLSRLLLLGASKRDSTRWPQCAISMTFGLLLR